MYNEKSRVWVSDCPDEKLQKKYYREAGEGKPEALFMLASDMLSEAPQGKQSAEAVYLMEQAAKDGYSPAMYAMGQLFQYGWAVQKNEDTALGWYRKAAACGYEPAVQFFKRRRKRKWAVICTCGFLGIVLFLGGLTVWKGAGWLYRMLPFLQEETEHKEEEQKPGEVKVGENTELVKTISFDEFEGELRDLISDYDDELVISGQQKTNRLILKFEGKELDLTDFLADRVISRENNMVVIQFSTEEEAERCLEELKKLNTIQFVEMDAYHTKTNGSEGQIDFQTHSSGGYQYYSWGADAMGFSELSEYAANKSQGKTVKVAVLDTGVEPHDRTRDRILEGWDIFGGNGQTDCDMELGHGTHVAGTILDCTQGADVEIIPVGVFEWSSTLGDVVASNASIIFGIEYAISAGADVMNMSLGGLVEGSEGESEMLRIALDEDIVVVVSAGNDADDTINYWPACEDACIVVGAIDEMCSVADFSNYGSSVDVVAPGVNILSDGTGDVEYRILAGTSQAAPHVTALAALLKMAYPNAKPKQIEKYIKDYSWPLGVDRDYYGEGIPLGDFFVEE